MKKTNKKVSKKQTKKFPVKQSKKVSHEIVVRVAPQPNLPAVPTSTELTEPMRDGKKLTLPKTWVSAGQLNQILQVTPKQYVYKRPGKGGQTFEYVTASYVTKALNYIFGWNWDFDIIEHGIEGGQVWCKGKLTVRGTEDGQVITKTQFGRNDIKYKKGTKEMLDFGNDLKGAASDAMKKCASLLGIASDIYGKADYKAETNVDPREPVAPNTPPNVATPENTELKEGQVRGPDGKPTYLCAECDLPVGDAGAAISKKIHGKVLCRDHYNLANSKKKQ